MIRRIFLIHIGLLATVIAPAFAGAAVEPEREPKSAPMYSAPDLDAGYRMLYELRFTEARQSFETWEGRYPENPLGDVSIAASYLFEELYRQGVLSSDFFLNDKRLLGGIEGKPDPIRAMNFSDANRRARLTAAARLKAVPQDADALYALTMITGMEADYVGILEHRQIESVRLIKQAEGYAKELLAVQPDAQDAWVALGTADYIIGSLPGPKRFFLAMGGMHGNKKAGLDELQRAAKHGQHLRPYAKTLLALASLREKHADTARALFAELDMEFPNNPVFAMELARLDQKGSLAGQPAGNK